MMGDVVPKKRSQLRARRVEGETVVLDRGTERIHQLNETASYIWDRCDGRRTLEDIASELAQDFDVDGQRALGDVKSAVRHMRDLGLLDLGGAGSAR